MEVEELKSSKPRTAKEAKPPIEFKRNRIENVNDIEYAGSFATVQLDNTLTLENFNENLEIEIMSMDGNDMEVEIKGIDAPLANALRRILIADVPTMAIDKAIIYQNTSILHDEILAHRLGLVPINVDPELFNFKTATEDFNETNSLQFKLHVVCQRKPQFQNSKYSQLIDMNPNDYLDNAEVYASDFQWEPIGSQAEQFQKLGKAPKALFGNILLTKLRENQEIELTVFCSKNTGRVHTKWSPVSTAFYRLMPDIEITRVIKGEEAKELKEVCPMDVFGIDQNKNLVVQNLKNCTMCRECIREDRHNDLIKLGKDRNHYIFTIESIGVVPPQVLFQKALQVLKEKVSHYLTYLNQLKRVK